MKLDICISDVMVPDILELKNRAWSDIAAIINLRYARGYRTLNYVNEADGKSPRILLFRNAFERLY